MQLNRKETESGLLWTEYVAIAPVGALERLRRERQESPFDVHAAAVVDSVAGFPSGLENRDLMLSGCVVTDQSGYRVQCASGNISKLNKREQDSLSAFPACSLFVNPMFDFLLAACLSSVGFVVVVVPTVSVFPTFDSLSAARLRQMVQI